MMILSNNDNVLGLYLYNRQTMAGKPLHIRAGYCFYHSTLFVLGSVLSWAVLSRNLSLSGCNTLVRSIIALGENIINQSKNQKAISGFLPVVIDPFCSYIDFI